MTGFDGVYYKLRVSEVSWVKFDRAFPIELAPVSPTLLPLIKIKNMKLWETLAKFEGKLIDKNEEISSSLFFSINKLLVLLAFDDLIKIIEYSIWKTENKYKLIKSLI